MPPLPSLLGPALSREPLHTGEPQGTLLAKSSGQVCPNTRHPSVTSGKPVLQLYVLQLYLELLFFKGAVSYYGQTWYFIAAQR